MTKYTFPIYRIVCSIVCCLALMPDVLAYDNPNLFKSLVLKYLESNADTDENRVAFIYDAFDKFLETVDKVYKKYDPHHLNLGMRFANPDTITEALLSICGKHFDVFSFNAYILHSRINT